MSRGHVTTQNLSLFERLESGVGRSQQGCVVESVANHLAKMLSTRVGSVQTLPDYGLPDLNDMRLSLHDSLSQARFLIERFIQAYEPRLKDVCVKALPGSHDPLALAFSIEGEMQVDGLTQAVAFCASLAHGAQVEVKPNVV
ncbi:type VI secretion system baseplate subunit TssE [Pseudomonas sp. Bout1]|uniref:type VI secretion system baseplate subunit TssE n=1 Tax=Pseudomonas sp. Bout1 TaxID=3048600 RepID=UPI002AB347EE|nr:type VI secretion system baseplate subunit TssE [Pseudomonas sp. Bout1]MDY7532741.1 type VI secretion system baseplate subunit TssE [Pseudomonas sp. Bout1]MEB0185141.1 type VI secretion system baseplate subunit TssE [Pseudomonas sp. Bout1]